MKKIAFRMVMALLLIASVSALCHAQVATSSSLVGTVKDQSGGFIPGADVLVKNNNTGAEYKAVTGEDGVFHIPALSPGTYTATVTVPNFKQAIVKDIVLTAGNPGAITVTLQVGGTNEVVTVQANAEIVQSQTATITTTMNVSQISSLPLSTRSALDFLVNLPGVNTTSSARNATVMGLPNATINITIDGTNTQDNYLKGIIGGDGMFSMIMPRIDYIVEDGYSNLSLRQRRSGQPHQLPLECVAADEQKENQENGHRRLTQGSKSAHRALPQEVTELESRLVHDDMGDCLARNHGGTGRLGRRLFHRRRCGLHLLHIADLAALQVRKPSSELGRCFGQLFDDGLHLAAQRIRSENERTDHACHHDERTNNARDLDRLEPCHKWIQRVGYDDAEQQRHHKGLRPPQGDNRSECRQNPQRQSPCINLQSGFRKGDERCVGGGGGLLDSGYRVSCVEGDWYGDRVHRTYAGKAGRRTADLTSGRFLCYLRRMSFLTDLTPATLRVTSTAVFSATCELTKPLS